MILLGFPCRANSWVEAMEQRGHLGVVEVLAVVVRRPGVELPLVLVDS